MAHSAPAVHRVVLAQAEPGGQEPESLLARRAVFLDLPTTPTRRVPRSRR